MDKNTKILLVIVIIVIVVGSYLLYNNEEHFKASQKLFIKKKQLAIDSQLGLTYLDSKRKQQNTNFYINTSMSDGIPIITVGTDLNPSIITTPLSIFKNIGFSYEN